MPSITFIQGIPSQSAPLSAYNPDAKAISLNGVKLPQGVTYDPVTTRFVYDGKGVTGTATGVVATAND